MPEINRRHPFAAEVIALQDPLRGKRKVDVEIVKSIAESHHVEYLGQGNDNFVYVHPCDPEKVIAVAWDDFVRRDRGIYYYHNLFSLLFPHNFPRLHAGFFYPDRYQDYFREAEYIVGSVRQRIHKGMDTPLYPFSTVVKQCDKYSIPLYYDDFPGNFIIGADGGEYYVDHLPRPDVIDPDPYLRYLQNTRPEHQKKALQWITRINTTGRG